MYISCFKIVILLLNGTIALFFFQRKLNVIIEYLFCDLKKILPVYFYFRLQNNHCELTTCTQIQTFIFYQNTNSKKCCHLRLLINNEYLLTSPHQI